MIKEPKVRPDGKCARKGCGKTVNIKRNPKISDQYAYLMTDPFCSTECAKIYYGIKMPSLNKKALEEE